MARPRTRLAGTASGPSSIMLPSSWARLVGRYQFLVVPTAGAGPGGCWCLRLGSACPGLSLLPSSQNPRDSLAVA